MSQSTAIRRETYHDQDGIHYHYGDLFTSTAQVIVNPVNLQGMMGEGLALAFRTRYPAMFTAYREACSTGRLRIGRPTLHRQSRPWIMNFPVKNLVAQPSKIEYIEAGLAYFAEHYREAGIESIAFPQLDCGGLVWDQVRPVMCYYLGQVGREGICSVFIILDGQKPLQVDGTIRPAPAPAKNLASPIPQALQQLLQEHRETGLAYHPEQPCEKCGCPLSYTLALYPDCRVCCRCLPGGHRYGQQAQELLLSLFPRKDGPSSW